MTWSYAVRLKVICNTYGKLYKSKCVSHDIIKWQTFQNEVHNVLYMRFECSRKPLGKWFINHLGTGVPSIWAFQWISIDKAGWEKSTFPNKCESHIKWYYYRLSTGHPPSQHYNVLSTILLEMAVVAVQCKQNRWHFIGLMVNQGSVIVYNGDKETWPWSR